MSDHHIHDSKFILVPIEVMTDAPNGRMFGFRQPTREEVAQALLAAKVKKCPWNCKDGVLVNVNYDTAACPLHYIPNKETQ